MDAAVIVISRIAAPIHIARDGWDWLLFGFSLFAALGVALAFWTWFGQQRRTPEVQFLWDWDNSPQWNPIDPPKVLKDFGPQRVRVHLRNVGAGSGGQLLINVLVPAWLQLVVHSDHESGTRMTDDPAVGGGPGTYQVIRKENFIPGTAVLVEFTIRVVADSTSPQSGYVALSVASEGFNRTGRRWLPSLAIRIPTPEDDYWANWSAKKYKRKVRIVRAIPCEVKAGPGQRMDRRSVEFDT